MKKLKISEVKEKDLPENMRKMTMVQREAYVGEMQRKRTSIQKQVNDLNSKRHAWCQVELEKLGQGKAATFESAVRKSVRSQAESKGLKFRSTKQPKPRVK